MINPLYHSKDYTAAMASRSMEKASWWVSRLPEDVGVVLDFGCANGAVLTSTFQLGHFTDWLAVGYDHSLAAIGSAMDFFPGSKSCWTNDLEGAIQKANSVRGPKVLLLSSVMHEVAAVQTLGDFLDTVVFPYNPDFIVFRDMAPARSAFYAPAPPAIRRKVQEDPALALRLRHFTARFGEISTVANLLHFLLKAPYEQDWMEELQENYFPMSASAWMDAFGPRYEPRFFDHHQPHFIRERMERLCGGLFIDQPTHLCMILERKLNGD